MRSIMALVTDGLLRSMRFDTCSLLSIPTRVDELHYRWTWTGTWHIIPAMQEMQEELLTLVHLVQAD